MIRAGVYTGDGKYQAVISGLCPSANSLDPKPMDPFSIYQGRVVRAVPPRQLLKTKIVATIGNEQSYKNGLYDRMGKRVEKPTYDWLIREFYESGVDVVRLNLAHLGIGKITNTFSEIKQAILKCERMNTGGKKIALLADLPGPKIRFKFTRNILFRVGRTFSISLKDRILSNRGATVYVDDMPLWDTLLKSDRKKTALRRLHIQDNSKYPTMLENVLGQQFTELDAESDSFQELMNRVIAKLNKEKVLVVIGDGDVFMEVKDIEGTTLKCTVVSVRAADTVNREKSEEIDSIRMKGNKGFTVKGVDLDIPSFTEEDRNKLAELLEAEYEGSESEGWQPVLAFVAVSFVQTANDILRTREYIEDRLQPYQKNFGDARLTGPSLVAKIETRKALQNEHFILDVADGVMVARGDLGLQTDIEEVPAMQKSLIRLCNKRGKPVITATEMLKSMTGSIEPTRAEGTDVFNAILDGSDAVMLSEETAQGKYPFAAIRKMISIAVQAERYHERLDMAKDLRTRANLLRVQEFLNDEPDRVMSNTERFKLIANKLDEVKVSINSARVSRQERDEAISTLEWRKKLYEEKWGKSVTQITTNRITQAACTLSEADDIKCIVAASTSGRTVRMISRLRPSVLIVGAAHDTINTRKLAVSYGVLPICIEEVTKDQGAKELLDECQIRIREDRYLSGFLEDGDTAVFTAGTPLREPGTTNLIQMISIGSDN